MSTSLRDNKERGSVGEFLKQQISQNSKLSIVSAYFTIYAYHKLKDKLDSIDSLRFLFGEPRFVQTTDPAHLDKRQYKIEDDKLVIPITDKLDQHKIAKECHDWLKEKAEIKSMVKPNFLHGKMYHIETETGIKEAILGSSNFTVSGLGLGNSPNIELNIKLTDDRDRVELLQWFDEIWNDDTGIIEDVKEKVLRYIQKIYADNSPEFIYYKTLYHLFSDKLDADKSQSNLLQSVGLYDSQVYQKLRPFQKHGVNGIIRRLEEHGGCILADSVGLGKTYQALAVIKYYESRNKKVLVLCPKKLENNWALYQHKKNFKRNPFPSDRYDYTLMYHTDLTRTSGISKADKIELEGFNWAKFDLVVIDESHNLRGNPKAIKIEGELKPNRVRFLLDNVIKKETDTTDTKVLMLSATPVNTTLKDIRNQIYFITKERDNVLIEKTGIASIDQTLRQAQNQFTKWSEKESRSSKDLMSELDASFFKILDEFTIARSRKHIKNNYKDDELTQFPRRKKPVSVYSELDTDKKFFTFDDLSDKINKYKLSIFNPQKYVLQEYKDRYMYTEDPQEGRIKAFTQEDREFRLIGMMKVGLLKRLESSVHSFAETLGRTADKIDNLLSKIEAFNLSENSEKDFDHGNLFNEELQEELEEYPDDRTVGKKFKYMLEHLDLEAWKNDLQEDRESILELYHASKKICSNRDAKLKDLKERISKKASKDNKKVLIFTAFSDTAEYLYKEIHKWAKVELELYSALVTGGGRIDTNLDIQLNPNEKFDDILSHFAPIAKERDNGDERNKLPEIDILIGTDCISEGQNLQDCDTVINYDIHWNPVRIIQRFGRIDRLYSPNEVIQLINYWPTKELDKYINLIQRVETRMAMSDATATGDENLFFNEDQEEKISFRAKQLERLKEEIIDLEDMDENISITEFNLDSFTADLMNKQTDHDNILKESPLGLFAIAPSPNHELWKGIELSEVQKSLMQPGIIFCFRSLAENKEYRQLNHVHPYFLLYIGENGKISYQFSHAKQILEIYRIIAHGRNEPITMLCKDFDDDTKQGKDMQAYNVLLKKSLENIRNTISQRELSGLGHHREALIADMMDRQDDKFELITWLIIK